MCGDEQLFFPVSAPLRSLYIPFKLFYFIFFFFNSGVLRTRKDSFWLPRNLLNHMDRQARTSDTLLVKSRELTGRSQTLLWWLDGGGMKTAENKKYWLRFSLHFDCINVQRTFPLSSSAAEIRTRPARGTCLHCGTQVCWPLSHATLHAVK